MKKFLAKLDNIVTAILLLAMISLAVFGSAVATGLALGTITLEKNYE